jgi:hypothetical protein
MLICRDEAPLGTTHHGPGRRKDRRGSDIRTWVLLSDDDGQNWRPSDSMLEGFKRGLMQPYIVENARWPAEDVDAYPGG